MADVTDVTNEPTVYDYLALVADMFPGGSPQGNMYDFVPQDFGADYRYMGNTGQLDVAPGRQAQAHAQAGLGALAASLDTSQAQGGDGTGAWINQFYEHLGLGGAGEWNDLIDKAIRENWSDAQFINAIYASGMFDRMFPGIKRPDGTLRMDVSSYRKLMDTYSSVAQDYGVEINKFRMGLLLDQQVSPDELATKLQAIQNVRANPGLEQTFNAQLKEMGMAPLDAQGWFRFVAGASSPDFYDAYEAALLRSSTGLNLGSAVNTARSIGAPGQVTDVASLVQQARMMKADIGPELAAQGITDDDLIKLEAGVDPKGIAAKVSTIINQRRARSSYVPGSYTRQGTGGGPALYEPIKPEAYG